jgi:hypothetical protein
MVSLIREVSYLEKDKTGKPPGFTAKNLLSISGKSRSGLMTAGYPVEDSAPYF